MDNGWNLSFIPGASDSSHPFCDMHGGIFYVHQQTVLGDGFSGFIFFQWMLHMLMPCLASKTPWGQFIAGSIFKLS